MPPTVIAEAATTVLMIALSSPPHPPRPPPPPPPPRPSGAATIAGGIIAARSQHVHSQRGRFPRHWFLCFPSRSSLEYSSRRGPRIAHSKSRRGYRPPRNGPERRLPCRRAKRLALRRRWKLLPRKSHVGAWRRGPEERTFVRWWRLWRRSGGLCSDAPSVTLPPLRTSHLAVGGRTSAAAGFFLRAARR